MRSLLILWAADLYVDAAAPAGGDGSQGAPFATLQAGLDAAQAGDTVHVTAGSYGAIATVRDGAETGRITVVAEPRGSAVIESQGTALQAAHTHHSFVGVVFDCGYGSGDCIESDGADHAEYLDVEVRRSGADCIDLRSTSDVVIEGAAIHHCVAGDAVAVVDAHGVTGDSVFDLSIRDSEIYLTSGDSVQLSPPREPWGNLVIDGCLLWTGALDEDAGMVPTGTIVGENALDTKVGPELDGAGANPRVTVTRTVAYGFRGFIGNQAAFNLKEAADVTVDGVTVSDTEIAFRLRGPVVVRVQNAVVHTVDKVARLEDALTGARIYNSTIGSDIVVEAIENGGGGDPVDLQIRNLLVLGDALPPFAMGDPSNLTTDAGAFVDAAAHDYHLQPSADAIDAGVEIAEVASDRDGVARPVGRAWDVGAYEWTDAPPGGTDSSGGQGDESGVDGSGGGGSVTDSGGPQDGSGGASEVGSGGSSDGAGSDGGGGCGCRTQVPRTAMSMFALVGLGLCGTGRSRRRRVR